MAFLVGIDVGTSGTKSVLFREDGSVLSEKTVEYPLYQPHNGWAEQDPEDWWNAVCEGVRFILRESMINPSDISGVGLSGQMHGLVMLDGAGKLLRRCIIWCDQRTGKEADELDSLIGRKRLIEVTANPALTSFTAAKILWVKNNEPQIYAECEHILLPKDYIRYRLTGEFATEVSDASGMQLMDIAKRQWSTEVLTKLDIDRRLLGTIHESFEVSGMITANAAAATGLAQNTKVAGGAADCLAAALGTGIVKAGRAVTMIGTSGDIVAHTDELKIDSLGRVHSLCSAVPYKWAVMSCTQAAGLSLRWLRDVCCAPETEEAKARGIDPYVVMSDYASSVPIGADRLLYLPYLMGERSPHLDPHARGVFIGLSAVHKRAHLIRAVMEGVAFSQRECVDVFRELGVEINDMMMCGGGARNLLWRQMLADLYGTGVSTIQPEGGAALGAAILAGVGTGVFNSVPEACDAVIQKNETCPAISENSAKYEPYYAIYRQAYLDLKATFGKLGDVS